MIKPDRQIYAYLLERYGLLPQECLFLDDLEQNVEAARQAKMAGEVFAGNFEKIKEQYFL